MDDVDPYGNRVVEFFVEPEQIVQLQRVVGDKCSIIIGDRSSKFGISNLVKKDEEQKMIETYQD